jgi:hypothetical protein
VLNCLASICGGARDEVFQWSDPAPAFRELASWLPRR